MTQITLATLAEATDQQVFDQVATHLLGQAETSYSSITDMCAYRGDNDKKCAAGCLIGDDEYLTGMDSAGGWASMILQGYVETDAHQSLISDLQNIHDAMHDEPQRRNEDWVREHWRDQLHDLAGKHNLSTEALAK